MEKKQIILNQARMCFMNFGYKSTTIDLIAKSVNMGKGTFYNFFQTKEEVFRSIVDMEVQGLITLAEQVKKMVPMNEEALLFYLQSALEYVKNGDFFHRLRVEQVTIGTAIVDEALEHVYQVAHQQLKELVIIFAKEKNIEKFDSELTSFLLLELYSSLVYRWNEKHEPLNYDRIKEVFLKLYPLV